MSEFRSRCCAAPVKAAAKAAKGILQLFMCVDCQQVCEVVEIRK